MKRPRDTQQERRFGARRNVSTSSIVFLFLTPREIVFFFSLFTIFSLFLNTIQYNSTVWTCEDRNDAKRDSLIVRRKKIYKGPWLPQNMACGEACVSVCLLSIKTRFTVTLLNQLAGDTPTSKFIVPPLPFGVSRSVWFPPLGVCTGVPHFWWQGYGKTAQCRTPS